MACKMARTRKVRHFLKAKLAKLAASAGVLVDAAITAPRSQTAAGTLGLLLFPFEPEPLDP